MRLALITAALLAAAPAMAQSQTYAPTYAPNEVYAPTTTYAPNMNNGNTYVYAPIVQQPPPAPVYAAPAYPVYPYAYPCCYGGSWHRGRR